MKIKCSNCDTINQVPDGGKGSDYKCYKCHTRLAEPRTNNGSTSAAVGLIGGAALGASIAGPAGAIVGGILGAVLGKESKGVG